MRSQYVYIITRISDFGGSDIYSVHTVLREARWECQRLWDQGVWPFYRLQRYHDGVDLNPHVYTDAEIF